MNWDLIFVFLFYGLIVWHFTKYRDKWELQGKIVGLYKTKLGIKWMQKIADAFPKTLRFFSGFSVAIGFIGMGFILYFLIVGTYALLFVKDAIPAVAPVLPGVRIPGLPNLGFWHWIIAIFIVATIHEFSHGVYSKLYKVKIKSSGFALFGPILGAFVEPDEKKLKKKSKFKQLAIFSAGPFSNILMAFVILLFINFVSGPVYAEFYEGTGIVVNNLIPGHAAEASGLETPFTVTNINGHETKNFAEFANSTSDVKPGDTIILETDRGTYTLIAGANPKNESRGFIGIADFNTDVSIKPEMEARYGTFIPKTVNWFSMLFFWLFVVSFGIGLFNLLPLGPIDGGRMFYVGLGYFVKNESKRKNIFMSVTLFCVLLIFINLFPYIWKLFFWIGKLFLPG